MAKQFIMTEREDGSYGAVELPDASKIIPVGMLNTRTRVNGGTFQHLGKSVNWAYYTEEGGTFMILDVPLMKWRCPIGYSRNLEGFIVAEGEAKDVYIEDISIVVADGAERNFYCVSRDGAQIPRLTNIYEDGKICTGTIDFEDNWMFISPRNAIKLLEANEGNLDLCVTEALNVREENKRFVIRPQLFSASNKFLKDRIHLR